MEQCWRSLLVLWLSVSRGTTHVLHGLALTFEVSCSGTAEIQEDLFKIINPVFYRVSNSNGAIKLRENGFPRTAYRSMWGYH